MIRPWKTWLVFAVCAAVLVGAMGWISLTALRLDHLQQHADAQADLEERVRLALWRMDSWLTPIVVEENSRPASDYQSFAPAALAYTKSLMQVKRGDVLLPSPLLTFSSSNILLHFQLDTSGQLTSPQVPPDDQVALAVSSYITSNRIAQTAQRLAALHRLLEQTNGLVSSPSVASSEPSSNTALNLAHGSFAAELFELTRRAANPEIASPAKTPLVGNNDIRQFAQQQMTRNSIESYNRNNFYRQARQQAFDNSSLKNLPPSALPTTHLEWPGMLQPMWLGDDLILARQVRNDTTALVQGIWLNWPGLKAALLESIKDILPAASLRPVHALNGTHEARALAMLPIQLVPGQIPIEYTSAWTPVQFSLVVAWTCVLLAGLAAGLLLRTTLALSERRAAFVSAVTHELRTPLTTFKMYSEMLAAGMVADEEKRKHYLATLCAEANRLNHLVENVLAYARLERGNARSRQETVTLGELIQRVKPRLTERAEQAGMQVVETVDKTAARTQVQVDVSIVEQILFNLVDNACKYASPTANEKLIHLEALPEKGKFALLRVRDHGKGISADAASKMFRPFNKSAMEAANTAAGVGLGLALCRRLSRSLGGDLVWDQRTPGGACFELRLPT